MRHEMTFVGSGVCYADRMLFLGPFDGHDGPFLDLPENWTLAHVMHAAGVFPSVGQARNNGWNRPVPKGFSMFTAGKRKLQIFIMTEFD